MTEDDPFRQPTRSAFPKMDDLEGSLVLIKPSLVETVPGYQGKGMVDRVTADVAVFGPEGIEEYEDMYLSQAGLVPSCKQALKPGAKPFVLGVVTMVPSKNAREKGYDTPEKIKAAVTEWAKKGGKGEKPQFAWGLAEYSDDQAQRAREYIVSKQTATDPFAAAAQ